MAFQRMVTEQDIADLDDFENERPALRGALKAVVRVMTAEKIAPGSSEWRNALNQAINALRISQR